MVPKLPPEILYEIVVQVFVDYVDEYSWKDNSQHLPMNRTRWCVCFKQAHSSEPSHRKWCVEEWELMWTQEEGTASVKAI